MAPLLALLTSTFPILLLTIGGTAIAFAVWRMRERRDADALRDLGAQLSALWARNPAVYDLVMSGVPLTAERISTLSPTMRADLEAVLRLSDGLGALASRRTTDRALLFALWPVDRMWASLQPLITIMRGENPNVGRRFEAGVAAQAEYLQSVGRSIVTDRRTLFITLAVGLGILIFALDMTIVSTALPTIVADLQGLNLYGWVFSSYAIAGTATALLYGRIADIAGRRQLFVISMAGFLAASMLCGLSQNMWELVAFRALQGIFGGATFPLAIGIIADTYPIERRAQGFAIVPTVFGVASVMGPIIGGVITETIGWRWVFFVNVPVVLAAILLLLRTYQDVHVTRARLSIHDFDPPGVVTLFGGLVLLLIALTTGGQELDWGSWGELTMLSVSVLLLFAFVWVERRSPRPLLPLNILVHRGLGGALLTIALISWITNMLTIFIPMFAQGTLGADPQSAGAILIPLMFTWSAVANLSVRVGQKIGFAKVSLLGVPPIIGGLVWLLFIGFNYDLWTLAPPLLLVGLGAGLINPNMMVLSQMSMSDRDQALAGGLTNVARSLAAAAGAAALTALELGRLSAHSGTDVTSPSLLLTAGGRGLLLATYGFDWVYHLQVALSDSLHDVFATALIAAVAMGIWLLVVVPSNRHALQNRLRPLRPAPAPEPVAPAGIVPDFETEPVPVEQPVGSAPRIAIGEPESGPTPLATDR